MQPYTLLLGLGALTSALPTATTTTDDAVAAAHQNPTRTLSTRGTIAETVAAIMPLSTSCASRGDECVTAAVAAPYFVSGMNHYGVATAVEQAGILALVAYESGQLQYKVNTNAANAAGGQGTSNEQSGAFNLEFANTFPELAALGLTTGTVLDHVTDNKYNFWTGPWFYTSQDRCASARNLASSGSTAWEWFQEYMSTCDGVPLDAAAQPDRITFWNNALAAFGLTNSSTAA